MLAAMTREFLDAGLRILAGSVLAVFFVGFALGGVILLPLVALVLALAALPGRLRAAARQLRGSGSQIRTAARSLRRDPDHVHARATLGDRFPIRSRGAVKTR